MDEVLLYGAMLPVGLIEMALMLIVWGSIANGRIIRRITIDGWIPFTFAFFMGFVTFRLAGWV